MSEQAEQIKRVREAIAGHVVAFLRQREGMEFYNTELHKFVSDRVTIAPGSADRIMRDLRAKGQVDYVVVSRQKSLYRALPVAGQMTLFGSVQDAKDEVDESSHFHCEQ